MKRRSLLKAFLGLGAATLMGGIARAAEGAHAGLTALLRAVPKTAGVVFFGDTNHEDRRLIAPFYDPAFMQSAAAEGFTDIYLEVPQKFQHYIEDMLAGHSTVGEFVGRTTGRMKEGMGYEDATFWREYMCYVAAIAQAAQAVGIKTHFADPQPIEEMAVIRRDALAERDTTPGLRSRITQYDPEVVQHILRASSGGRVMVVYGFQHLLRRPDNNQARSMDNDMQAMGVETATIALVDTENLNIASVMAATGQAHANYIDGNISTDRPDAAYVPLTGAFSRLTEKLAPVPGEYKFDLTTMMLAP